MKRFFLRGRWLRWFAPLLAALLCGPLVAVLVADGGGTAVAEDAGLAPAAAAASTHVPAGVRRDFAELPHGNRLSTRLTIGSAPLVPLHALLLGRLPADARLSAEVALVPSDAAGLSQFATEVSTPGSPQYRHYLSVGAFRARFGASPGELADVRRGLAASGLALGAPAPNGLSFSVTGTVAQLERAFGTTIDRLALPGGRIAFSNAGALSLPATFGRAVQAVIGLSDVFLPHRESATPGLRHAAPAFRVRPLRTTPLRTSPAGAGALPMTAVPTDAAISTCSGATTEAADKTVSLPAPLNVSPYSTAAYTGQQIAQAYDFDPLYASGDEGQGVTVGLFELEPNFPADITAFEACYGITATVNYVAEGGGAGTASASADNGLETELDAENVLELAPRATVDIYQAPDTSTGVYDDYSAMVTNSAIRVISSSWGECEADTGPAYANAESTLFQEAASEGMSVVAAAGNSGAEGCAATLGPITGATTSSSSQLSVDDPASQPFVTGVGGTSLNAVGASPTTAPSEVVWNNGPTLAEAGSGGAGGGGISELWQMPGYQASASASLKVINANSSASCKPLQGDCREVPDVSADADPSTAYVVYWNGGWTTVGGTSGAAPLWAALFADADANSGCQAHGGIGFANPDLYGAAGNSTADYASYFNDITSGNNDVYDTNSGKYAAAAGYDVASGLGTPIAGNLVPALCAEAVALNTPTHPGPTTVTVAKTTTTGSTVTGPSKTTTTSSTTTVAKTSTSPPVTTTVPTVSTTVIPVPTTVLAEGSAEAVTTRLCEAGKQMSFVQHPIYPVDATKVVVYIDGKLVKRVTGRRIVDVMVKRPKVTKFTVKLVTWLSDGERIQHTLTVTGCSHGKVKAKVLKPPR